MFQGSATTVSRYVRIIECSGLMTGVFSNLSTSFNNSVLSSSDNPISIIAFLIFSTSSSSGEICFNSS